MLAKVCFYTLSHLLLKVQEVPSGFSLFLTEKSKRVQISFALAFRTKSFKSYDYRILSLILTQSVKRMLGSSCHQAAWVMAPYFATVILKNKISLLRHIYAY